MPSGSPPATPSNAPDDSEGTSIPPTLRRLLDESSDLIDSPSFHHVLTLLLDSAFSLLIDNKIASMAFKIPPTSASSARVQELVDPATAKAKVANTLAVFCRQAHAIGSGGQGGITSGVGLAAGAMPAVGGNEYLAQMEQVKDLEAFAAVVYSSNFDFESPEITVPGFPSVNTTRPGTAVEAEPAKEKDAEPDAEKEQIEGKRGFEAAWEKALAKEDGKDQA